MNIPALSEHPAISSVARNQTHSYKISAIYTDPSEAESVKATLLKNGFLFDDVEILYGHENRGASDEVITEIMLDSAIGSAVGAGIGAIGTAILITASATLFIASPILAPLMLIGSLASAGGLVGGVLGASLKETKYADVVTEAMKAGNVLLLVHTYTETDRNLAKQLIADSFRGRDEVVMESE